MNPGLAVYLIIYGITVSIIIFILIIVFLIIRSRRNRTEGVVFSGGQVPNPNFGQQLTPTGQDLLYRTTPVTKGFVGLSNVQPGAVLMNNVQQGQSQFVSNSQQTFIAGSGSRVAPPPSCSNAGPAAAPVPSGQVDVYSPAKANKGFTGYQSVTPGSVLSAEKLHRHQQQTQFESNSSQVTSTFGYVDMGSPPAYEYAVTNIASAPSATPPQVHRPMEASTAKPSAEHRPLKSEESTHCYGSTVQKDEGSDGSNEQKWENFR